VDKAIYSYKLASESIILTGEEFGRESSYHIILNENGIFFSAKF
jgi:hypothetical protein